MLLTFFAHVSMYEILHCEPVKIPVDNRKCVTCNKLEDEYHFVLECSIFDLRKQYILRKFWVRPSMFKFIELINNENKTTIRNLGTYIHNAVSSNGYISCGNLISKWKVDDIFLWMFMLMTNITK